MKIAVSSMGKTLESDIDPRFGRCKFFLVIDTESKEFEVFPNESSEAIGGAGIQAAQFVADIGVKVVLTGNVGPNAFDTLNAAGIEILTGIEGTVKEAIERYNEGELNRAQSSTVDAHFGMGSNRGRR